MMKILKTEIGIHTFELYAKNLKYQEVQRTVDYLADQGSIQMLWSDSYHIDRYLASKFFVDSGIRLQIHQSHDHSNGIGLIINPSTLLAGAYQPTQLYKPTKKSYQQLLTNIGHIMMTMGLGQYSFEGNPEFIVAPEDLSLSQIDLTANLWFDSDTDLTQIIALFRKGNVPKELVRQKQSSEQQAHSFGASNHTVAFKAYDKIFELTDNGRCPKRLRGEKLLRLEVSLKREAFLKKADVKRNDSLYKMLRTGFDMAQKTIRHYLEKLFPCSGPHIRYKNAKDRVQSEIDNPDLQEKMLFLLEKTSQSAGLDSAVRKLSKSYKSVKKKGVKPIYSAFDQLGINPITLNNNSPYQAIDCIRTLVLDAL